MVTTSYLRPAFLFLFSYNNSLESRLGKKSWERLSFKRRYFSFQGLLAALRTAQFFLLLLLAQGLLETWLFQTPFWNTRASCRSSFDLSQVRTDPTLTYQCPGEDISDALKHSRSDTPLSVQVTTSMKRLKNAIRK